jgi:PAS domain S-box-containing protein
MSTPEPKSTFQFPVLKTNTSYPHLQDERIFHALVESVRDYAIFMLDPDGVVATWNPGAERIKQYQASEIIGRHFSVFYPEGDIRAGKPQMELRVAAAEGRFEDEGWRKRKDGTRFWANVVITAVRDESGKLLGFGKITRDLTDRRASELGYRLLVEGVTDYSIFSLDKSGFITSWNSGAQRIKGYSADEIIGQHFSKFYTEEDIRANMPQEVLRIARETGHFEGEGRRVRKDGSTFWSSVVVTPLRDEQGNLYGFSKITRDITERKKLLDNLTYHAEELEVRIAERDQTNAELEAFSYSVSHDLRAPLRAIEGFAAALREDYGKTLDEAANEYLGLITSAAARMNQLVHDLLGYARLNRIDIVKQPIAVADLVHRVLDENFADQHNVTAPDASLSLSVMGHGPTLFQVLSNLIGNALKFQKPGIESRVEITAARNGNDFVRISVSDNGIGIAPRHLERIFNVFERLHSSEEYPGTGIGLAIVKRGMERLGGRCGVESTPGEGSLFWIELPEATP